MKRSIVLVLISLLCVNLFAQNKKDALVLYQHKNYKEAISVCEEELRADPNRVEAYVVLCWSLVGNREYARAEQRAYDGLKLARYDIRLIEVLGEAKYYQGKNEEALKQFQEYISIAQDRTGDRVGSAYYFMGEIYIRLTKFQHADIALSAAVRKRPRSDVWWFRLGYAPEMAKNYAESLTAYEECLKLNPTRDDAVRGKERVKEHLR